MALVAPSILSADFGHLADDIREVVSLGAQWVHCDVMDGRFVPNLTFGPGIVKVARKAAGTAVVDAHLMIVEPDRYLSDFAQAGADYITVHAEACTHLHRTVQAIRDLGCKAGVALNPHTHPDVLDYVLEDLDLVLVMSVNPGFGGQSLIESAFRKLAVVRERIEAAGLETLVQVDGGVKPDNAEQFTEAGAHVLVSGSGIYKAVDRGAAIRALLDA